MVIFYGETKLESGNKLSNRGMLLLVSLRTLMVKQLVLYEQKTTGKQLFAYLLDFYSIVRSGINCRSCKF